MAKGKAKAGKVAELQRALGAGDHEAFTFAHARHVIDGEGGSIEETEPDEDAELEEEEEEGAAPKPAAKKKRAR